MASMLKITLKRGRNTKTVYGNPGVVTGWGASPSRKKKKAKARRAVKPKARRVVKVPNEATARKVPWWELPIRRKQAAWSSYDMRVLDSRPWKELSKQEQDALFRHRRAAWQRPVRPAAWSSLRLEEKARVVRKYEMQEELSVHHDGMEGNWRPSKHLRYGPERAPDKALVDQLEHPSEQGRGVARAADIFQGMHRLYGITRSNPLRGPRLGK
jgi:hypothetical protein